MTRRSFQARALLLALLGALPPGCGCMGGPDGPGDRPAGASTPANETSSGATSTEPTGELQDANPDPSEPTLADLVIAQRNQEALTYLDSIRAEERPVGALYLRARLLERMDRRTQAIDAYEASRRDEQLPDEVAEDAEFRRMNLLVREQRCEEALPALDRISARRARDEAAEMARFRRAECALLMDQAEDARTRLLAVLEEDARPVDRFRAYWLLADAALALDDPGAAIDALREALLQRPHHSQVDEARARYIDLAGHPPDWSLRETLERAETLLDRRRPRRALELLDTIEAPTDPSLRAEIDHLRGMSLYSTRHDYAEAAAVLARAATVDTPHRADDAFHAARALARADRDAEAVRAFRVVADEHAGTRTAAHALYLAAWLELRHEMPDAETHMRAFIDHRDARRRPDLRRAALFQLGIRAYRSERWAEAAELFTRYATSGSGPDSAMEEGRGHYWAGRSWQGGGEPESATLAFDRARSIEPLHWYAQWSDRRLGELGHEPRPVFSTESAPPEDELRPPASPTLPEVARFYARLGLTDDAASIIRSAADRIRAQAPRGRRQEWLVAAYRAVGATSAAFRVAALQRSLLDRAPGPETRWAWEAAYPRPYAHVVREVAEAGDVPPAYVWATMRQESAFDPGIRSHAGAVGLLQMMPQNARRRARALEIPYRRGILEDPVVNIRFGVDEIAQHLERYDGHLALAVAAYNAGFARVDSWLERSGEMDTDLFVEEIPFNETRNYVRRVLSHYARYRFLERSASPSAIPATVSPRDEG